MPSYIYKAKDNAGKNKKGTIMAESLADFYTKLREKELYCLSYTEINEKKNIKTIYKLKEKELVILSRKLGSMLGAGMSVKVALDVLYSTAESYNLKKVLLAMHESIQRGNPLSESMREQGNAFPQLFIHMTESGELGGDLDKIMIKLSRYYEKHSKLKSRISAATAYPKILIVVCLIVIIAVFTFVLPNMFSIFESQVNLPKSTVIIMAISNFLVNNYIAVISMIAILFLFGYVLMSLKSVAALVDRLKVTIPVFGKLVSKIYSSHFASSMAVLYSSGIPLITSLKMAVTIVGSPFIEAKFSTIVDSVSKGSPLSLAIDEVEVFDKMLPSMIRIGEESGSLDTVLEAVAQYYDLEAEAAIDKILGLVEPILMIVMAFIIGTIVISVITPIFGMYSSISAG